MKRAAVAIPILAAAVGCTSIPRDSGFDELQRDVAARSGLAVEWRDDAVAPQLAGELDADHAVRVALANNRSVQATLEELGIARGDYMASVLVRNPILGAEIRFPGSPLEPFEISLMQSLIDLIQLPRRRKLGAAEFEAARLRVEREVLTFAADVRTRFYELLAAENMQEARGTTADAARVSVGLAQRQYGAGNISDLDLENEQALYEQAKLDLAKAEAGVVAARRRLAAAMGIGSAETAWRTTTSFPEMPAEIALVDGDENATSRRLDIAMAQHAVEVASRALPLARGGAIGDVSAGVHFEREPEGKRTTGPAIDIPIPIFNRGTAARARAEAVLRQARQRLAALMVNARVELRLAADTLSAARVRVEYLRDIVLPRRKRILDLTQVRYNAMQAGVFQLLSARQNEANGQAELIEAQREYWLARVDLDRAVNGLENPSNREGIR